MRWFDKGDKAKSHTKDASADLPMSVEEAAAFRESQSLFYFLFQNLRRGAIIFKVVNGGEDFTILNFNKAAERLENVKKEDVTGKSVVEVFPGIRETGLLEVFKRVWLTGTAEFHPATLYRDSRRTGWRENHVFRLPAGEIVVTYEDVTEQKRAELAIRMSEQKFRAIADYTYNWESWIGPTGVLFWVNPAVEKITGYEVAECMKMADYPLPLIHEKDREMMAGILTEARKGGSGRDIEFRIRRKDGSIIWGEMAWQAIYDKKGVSQGIRASISDITERALAQEALKSSEERYRALVENVELGILLVDVHHTIIMANSAAGRLFGRSINEFTGRKCDELFTESVEGFAGCPGDMAFEKHGRVVVEMEAVRADGSRFPVKIQAFAVYPQGEMSGYFIEVIEDITDEKHSKEQLIESEERYRSFVQNFKGVRFRVKLDLTPVFVHGAVEEITGYTEQDFVYGNLRWDQIVHPNDLQSTYYGESRKLQTVPGYSCERQYRIVRKDGEVHWVNEAAQNVNGKDGKIAFIQGDIYDVTERKLAEAEVEKLANIPNENPFPVLRISADGTIMYHNRASEPVLAVWQRRRGDHISGKWYQMVIAAFSSAVPQEAEIDCEGKIFSLVFAPIAGADYVNIYGRDITSSKRAEEELREEERKYRDLVETMNEGLDVTNKDYIFTYVNKRFSEMLGYAQDEITGHHVTDFLDEANRDVLQRQRDERSAGRSGAYDIAWTARDGHKVYTLVSPKGMYDEQGNFQGSFGVIMDVSDRKKVQDELHKKEKLYRDLIEAMNEGLGVADKDYIFTYVNRRLAEMLGYQQNDMKGRYIGEFMDEPSRRILHEQISERRAGRAEPYDVTWIAVDGRKIYTLVSPKGMYDEQSNFQGSFGVIMDVSERKMAYEEREHFFKLLEAKNKELESVLHILSHDLKADLMEIENLDNGLTERLEMIRSAMKGKVFQADENVRKVLDTVIPEMVKSIASNTARMDSLLTGVLRLSQADSVKLNIQQLRMDDILGNIVDTMRQRIKEKRVTLAVESLPDCKADAVQIREVFSNLLDNAIKYLDDSRPGRIRVSDRTEENWSIYCVEDNGIGIDRQYYEKIFDVFYQFGHEKEKGEGLGLGLSIVKRILERHNGKVWVESEPGKGSKFYISLPRG